MKADTAAWLYDVRAAARAVMRFTECRTFSEYVSNEELRSAVERKFEVMGEALARIRWHDPDVLCHIRHHRDIISFRNVLAHGYDSIDDRVVWNIIQEELVDLLRDVEKLLPAGNEPAFE